MMKRRSLLTILLVAVSLAAVCEAEGLGTGAAVRDYFESWLPPTGCAFCGRRVHADMRVAFQKENEDTVRMACCLRCVITEAEQTGERIRVLWVTDFVSHERLQPDKAIYLVGSTINSDSGLPVEVPWNRREQSELKWDRCLPSVIAFSGRSQALKFQLQAGGDILTFRDLVAGTGVTFDYHSGMP